MPLWYIVFSFGVKKEKLVKYLMFVFLMLVTTGCFQVHNDDCAYYTVPTTNNPNIVPNHSTFAPGLN